MEEHSYLLTALLLTSIVSGLVTYNRYQRDWCGIRLIPYLIIEALPSLLIVIILYKDFFDAFSFIQIYRLPISLFAVVAAEYVKHLILKFVFTSRGIPKKKMSATVALKIARKKVDIVDRLEQNPKCKTILENALNVSDLSRSQKDKLRKPLVKKIERQQIFKIVEEVGVNIMKRLV